MESKYNKVDLRDQGIPVLPTAVLEKDLNSKLKMPSFEASALTGYNVPETLKKITTEDPSLQVTHRANLNETLFTGIGEMHLQIALDKMKEQFNLEVDTSTPSIDYRETIRQD